MTTAPAKWPLLLILALLFLPISAPAESERAHVFKETAEEVYDAALRVAQRHSVVAAHEEDMALDFSIDLGTDRTFEPSRGFICNASIQRGAAGGSLLEISIQKIPSLSGSLFDRPEPYANFEERAVGGLFIRELKKELKRSGRHKGGQPLSPSKPTASAPHG